MLSFKLNILKLTWNPFGENFTVVLTISMYNNTVIGTMWNIWEGSNETDEWMFVCFLITEAGENTSLSL